MENEGSLPTVPDGSDEEPIAASTALAGAATGIPLWRVGLLVTTVALAVVFVAITGLGFVSGGGPTQPAAPTAAAAFPGAPGLPTVTAPSTDGPTATPSATAPNTGSGPGGGAPTPTPRPTPRPTATPTPKPTSTPTPTPGSGGG